MSPFLRVYAALVDALFVFSVLLILSVTTQGLFLGGQGSAPQDIFFFFGYFVFLTGIKGQTLGKWVAGIIVVDSDGRTPGVAAAIPREMVGKFVGAVAFGLGLIWMVFDEHRQGWHDKIAGTYVVRKRHPGGAPSSSFWGRMTGKD